MVNPVPYGGGGFGGGGLFGGALSRGLGGFANAFQMPQAPQAGFGAPQSFQDRFGDRFGQLGNYFAARGAPRAVDAPPPQMPQMGGGYGRPGGLPGGFPGGFPGGMQTLPPEILQMIQAKLGPASQAGWGIGTTATPAQSPWQSPGALIASLFNRGGAA